MEELDLVTCPLDGANLIEASAGTGKTYTIAALFLRMIVEKNIPVENILVVTFTRAATEELKERLCTVLQQAREVFAGRQEGGEGIFAAMKANPAILLADKEERVRRALRDFDEAAIYTIHGFCQRQLVDHAFASGSLYDSAIVTDLSELVMDCLRDFWRCHVYDESPHVLAALPHFRLGEFFRLYGIKNRNPALVVAGGASPPERAAIDSAHAELVSLCRDLRSRWPADEREAVTWLALDRKLLDGSAYRRDVVEKAARTISAFVRSEAAIIDESTCQALGFFTTDRLRAKARKPGVIPIHPFFDLAAALIRAADAFRTLCRARLLFLQERMFSFVEQRLTERKKKENILTFNDFLVRLRDRLIRQPGSGGGLLGEAIRTRYEAALIDEFQDTDPLQYAIFSTLFAGRRILFLIGDPKQAIYSFRGADVYAYLQAAARVDRRYTLPNNYRSDPLLVQGVNAVFAGRPDGNPFAEPQIGFTPVKAALSSSPLVIVGEEERPPLVIWSGDQDGTGEEKQSTTRAAELVNRAILAEIHRLLTLAGQGRASLRLSDGTARPLRPSDFAVLVRSRRQMEPVQQLLIRHGIPAVVSGSASVFDTEEAAAMELLLAGIAAPGRMAAICGALATLLFGLTASHIQQAAADPGQWDAWVLTFRGYHDLCRTGGFLAMFRRLLAEHGVRTRLMARPGGERSLTNFLHLAELLHLRQVGKGLGVSELFDWFVSWRRDASLREEEMELRLESDDDAVRIVTIHKSKGLEYPIVFAPFVWGGSEVRENLCHDSDGRIVLYLDDNAFADRQGWSFRENLSENLRLFYVALTRARHRCYTFWDKFDGRAGAHTSAPAYLFHGKGAALDPVDPAGQMKALYEGCETSAAVAARLHAYFAEASDAVAVCPLPRPGELPVLIQVEEGQSLSPVRWNSVVPPARQITSFSALTRDQHGEGDGRRDRDDLGAFPAQSLLQPESLERQPFSIFSFVGGARAGTFMHDLLQHLDFSQADETTVRELVNRGLRSYGFAADFAPALCAMLTNVVRQPLDGFTLADIDRNRRADELEFFFPLQRVRPADLAALFVGATGSLHGDSFARRSTRLTFSPRHGSLHGFIDLVLCWGEKYYLIDWKSNLLGQSAAAYDQRAVLRAMTEHDYYLQYHLYTLALHLHLANSLPDYSYERHFGGVYYLFLRGIDPGNGADTGVFFDRPAPALVARMEAVLLPSRGWS
ncbi:MAG: exodeoxyribonuclease V subunit beta [Thermodesulfobacteriota bacterium]